LEAREVCSYKLRVELDTSRLVRCAEVGEELSGGLVRCRVRVKSQDVGVVADYQGWRDGDGHGEIPLLFEEGRGSLVDSGQYLRDGEVDAAERQSPGPRRTLAFSSRVKRFDGRRDGSSPVLKGRVGLLDADVGVGGGADNVADGVSIWASESV